MMPLLTLVVLVQFFAAARPLKFQNFRGEGKKRERGTVNIVGRFRQAWPSMLGPCPGQRIRALMSR
jgi:hypothetical protein